MDVNGTRFHLLLGQDDWGACTREGGVRLADDWEGEVSEEILLTLGWDKRRSELILPSVSFQFPTAPKNKFPELPNRRGAGADSYGNWYWIDDDESAILVRSAGSGKTTSFWRPDDGVQCEPPAAGSAFKPLDSAPSPPVKLRGLTVTSEHYLVAGVLQPPGLLIFDLQAGGPPQQLLWPEGFTPFDMAPGTCGGVWILDKEPNRPTRLWALDRRMNIIRLSPPPAKAGKTISIFRPLEGSPPESQEHAPPPPGISLEASFVLPGDVVAVEGLPDGTALLLDNKGDGQTPSFSQVWRYTMEKGLDGPYMTRDLTRKVEEKVKARFSLLGHDFAFVSEAAQDAQGPAGIDIDPPMTCPKRPVMGKLLIVSQDGNQAYALDLNIDKEGKLSCELDREGGKNLKALAEFWPMRLFGGRGLVSVGTAAYYDSQGEWIPLVEQKRPRYYTERILLTPANSLEKGNGGDTASMLTPDRPADRSAFDGHDPDCVWHRLIIDGCIPPDAQVQVWSRAANSQEELESQPWQHEPNPYRRGDGSELPFLRPGGYQDEGTWETLFQSARGRFLQLRIVLRGNGRSTPRLRAMRIYYPRFSYLNHYLPAVYREEAGPASFLDRFLANFEGMYTALEDRIAAVLVLFDARTVPAEYLDWLAGWFGVMLDPHWEEIRRRLFIAHATELFRQRGTEPGLIQAIRLATDARPDETIFADVPVAGHQARRPSPIRIVERYRTRLAPGLIFGDPTGAEGPGLTTEVSKWKPEHGPEPLHRRYREYLQEQYSTIDDLKKAWARTVTSFEDITLPPIRPMQAAEANDWERFLRARLGFTYAAVKADDLEAYRDFLARRYGQISKFNAVYDPAGKLGYTSFEKIEWPNRLPEQFLPLRDWIQFVSVLMPTALNAHRFTILVPVTIGEQAVERGALMERVRRVVEREKPAHTTFDVKEYWAAFCVGEARLGFDTLLGRGSRLAAVALNLSYLAGGYLGPSHPWALTRRLVVGRDRIEDARPL